MNELSPISSSIDVPESVDSIMEIKLLNPSLESSLGANPEKPSYLVLGVDGVNAPRSTVV